MGIEEKVKVFIEKERLIRQGDRILLGLSGGADSVCLFYLLLGLREEMGFELRAVHVHHGIREEAEEDAVFVKGLCEKEEISCCIFGENVPEYARGQGLSEEEAGRILRYQDFQQCLENWKAEDVGKGTGLQNNKGCVGQVSQSRYKIAVAHHENDQAETVLFQLFRGCGLSGLRGILPERENIIRPLLCLSRGEIEGCLRERNIVWCEDKTNALEEYSRNKIRHKILPYAEAEISNGVISHIGKTAEIVREAEAYIRRQVEAVYQRVVVEKDGISAFDIMLLIREDVFLQKELILYGLEKVSAGRKDVGSVHVEDILKLAKKHGNGELYLPGRMRVKKVYQRLLIWRTDKEKEEAVITGFTAENKGYLCGGKEPLFRTEKIELSDEEAVKKRFHIQNISEIMGCIPEKIYTKWFDYDKIETVFSIRHRESGDYLTIDDKMNHKSFRRYMMEKKIPASHRDHIWIFADGSHVMWIPGGRMSAYYKVTEQTKTILQVEICLEE